jgi:hypothetical protein
VTSCERDEVDVARSSTGEITYKTFIRDRTISALSPSLSAALVTHISIFGDIDLRNKSWDRSRAVACVCGIWGSIIEAFDISQEDSDYLTPFMFRTQIFDQPDSNQMHNATPPHITYHSRR